MNMRFTLTLMCSLALAPLATAQDISLAPAPAQQSALEQYTAPLEQMFSVIEQVNTILASAQDEETAEAAGEAILPHLKQLDNAAKQFLSLPMPEPQLEQQIMAWFGEREHIMEEMAKQVERLEQEDPAFFGSQTLISSIIMLGGVLGGAQ